MKNKKRTTKINNKLHAILYAKNKGKYAKTESCIFCSENHIHALEDGHRVAHCAHRKSVRLAEGWVNNNDGYVVYIEK